MFPNLLGQKAFHCMTDKNMADVIGVSRAAYRSKMANGRFTAEECKKYCLLFGKSFEFLFATE